MPKGTELTREGFRAANRSLGKQPLPRPDFIEKNQSLRFINDGPRYLEPWSNDAPALQTTTARERFNLHCHPNTTNLQWH
ncbi:hypothetical protein TNCV_1486301 [Trichonephila clavipes]|nr:hypothetical protein TNCV_1486301 [Trichonephila clavipes]